MLFLASFILKGQSQAALVAAAMAVLGVLLPPATWISAAAIVLVTLVHGPQRGLITTAMALLGSAIFTVLIFSTPQIALMFLMLAWLPAWLVAMVLRQSVSLAYSLQVLTAMGLLAVAMLYMLYPNFGEMWREPLDTMVNALAKQSNDVSLADLVKAEDWIIAILPGLFASSIMFGTMLSLFLGRWWQAVNFNPGGFGEEFRSLNLGKASALVALVIVVLTIVEQSVFATALIMVVSILYGIQAMSLLHATIAIRKLNAVWVYAVYVVMLFIPHVLLLLMLASFIDPWIDVRQRISQLAKK